MEVTYYFNSYDVGEIWTNNPQKMVDNITSNYASTDTDADVQLLNANTCVGTNLGSISKVELRAYGINDWVQNKVNFRPVFNGVADGDIHVSTIHTSNNWSNRMDITSDTNAPGSWSWSDIQNLDMDVISYNYAGGVAVSKVEIIVTYSNAILSLSVPTLTGFTYVEGSGPSTEQSYDISGTALDLTDVIITPPTNYEISLTSGSGFISTPITLSAYDGTLTTIYVRLATGLSIGTYNSEVITNAGGGASTVNVTCSGEVTAPPVVGGILTTNSKYW